MKKCHLEPKLQLLTWTPLDGRFQVLDYEYDMVF